MAAIEIEGPDSGWVATVGYDDGGLLRVLMAREGWLEEADALLGRLIQEPAPSGRIPGEQLLPDDDEVLYDLASSLTRRKPECRGERLTGYVVGGSRFVEPEDYGEQL